MLKFMKNKPIIIISGDPKSTFNEILIKTLKNKVLKNINFPIIIIEKPIFLKTLFFKVLIKISLKVLSGSPLIITIDLFFIYFGIIKNSFVI